MCIHCDEQLTKEQLDRIVSVFQSLFGSIHDIKLATDLYKKSVELEWELYLALGYKTPIPREIYFGVSVKAFEMFLRTGEQKHLQNQIELFKDIVSEDKDLLDEENIL